MREQPTKVKTGAVKNRVITIALVFAFIVPPAVLFFALFITERPAYIPPPYEINAITGIPEPPEHLSFSEKNAFSEFNFGIVGELQQLQTGTLPVYLTNFEENNVYLMCEIMDVNGVVLYRSGLLRPGEYMPTLEPLTEPLENRILVEINIYALDMNGFYSMGTMTLINSLRANQ